MDALLFVLGGAVLVLVGGWTVTHPNGGYRAAGGAGSGIEEGTRRVAGYATGAVGVALSLIGASLLL